MPASDLLAVDTALDAALCSPPREGQDFRPIPNALQIELDHVAGNALAPSESAVLSLAKLDDPGRQCRLSRSDHGRRGPDGRSFSPAYLLKFNDTEIELIPNPGLHSAADLLVYFPKAGILCLGDLLLSQSWPAVGNAAGYLEFLDKVLDVFPPPAPRLSAATAAISTRPG